MTEDFATLRNGSALPLADIPQTDFNSFRSLLLEQIAGGAHLAALFPIPAAEGFRLLAVLVDPGSGALSLFSAAIGESFSSLTPDAPEAHAFEREMAEQWGVIPTGHPWLKPLRFQEPLPGGTGNRPNGNFGTGQPSVMDFFSVEGEEVHEVAVGPVHAGVIEPGHFRFQCHGESVFHLEISLGYQHRDIERRLAGGPDKLSAARVEAAAGDTTVGHSLAYAMNIEALGGMDVDPRAGRVRAAALELERLANHTGDLGALSGDVGYLPTANYCGRLRGEFLNLTALLCGNRFSRGLIAPGGLGQALDRERADLLLKRLKPSLADTLRAARLLFSSPSVVARFEEVGRLSRENASHLGLVGPAARASGLPRDIRLELPYGPYAPDLFELPIYDTGDVMARARVRRREIEIAAALVEKWLGGMEAFPVPAQERFRKIRLAPETVAVSLVEGWRGEICHVALTGEDGCFRQYKIVDPSFHNWFGLAVAMRGQQISDFPLCNKSFNLSYCGHDL